jgi:hypothetical protein
MDVFRAFSGRRGLLGSFLLLATLVAPPGALRALAAQGDCGQPVSASSGPQAGDALAVLRAAVGTTECAPCVCDVDRSGAVAASDALRTLRRAVGQAVDLRCVSCAVSATIGAGGGRLATSDGTLRLTIPPGALAGDVEITIEGKAPATLPGGIAAAVAEAWSIQPAGLELAEAATVEAVTRFAPATPPAFHKRNNVGGADLPPPGMLVTISDNPTGVGLLPTDLVQVADGVLNVISSNTGFGDLALVPLDEIRFSTDFEQSEQGDVTVTVGVECGEFLIVGGVISARDGGSVGPVHSVGEAAIVLDPEQGKGCPAEETLGGDCGGTGKGVGKTTFGLTPEMLDALVSAALPEVEVEGLPSPEGMDVVVAVPTGCAVKQPRTLAVGDLDAPTGLRRTIPDPTPFFAFPDFGEASLAGLGVGGRNGSIKVRPWEDRENPGTAEIVHDFTSLLRNDFVQAALDIEHPLTGDRLWVEGTAFGLRYGLADGDGSCPFVRRNSNVTDLMAFPHDFSGGLTPVAGDSAALAGGEFVSATIAADEDPGACASAQDAERLLVFEDIVSPEALEDVRGFPFSFVELPGGRIGVSTGDLVGMQPGEVFRHGGDADEPVVSYGDGGLDMRAIRCLQPTVLVGLPNMCFVTVFRDDAVLPLLLQDGNDLANPHLASLFDVGDGPGGIDLRIPPAPFLENDSLLLAAEDGEQAVVEVLTSAFFDHAVTRTLVAADGSVVDQFTIEMPEDCRGPSSVAWLEGGGFAVTCNTTDNLVIFPEQAAE